MGKLYAGDLPSKVPALLDTIPMQTHLPNQAQTALSLVSAANTVHDTANWKCDSFSGDAASLYPALVGELLYAYVEAGNRLPACVPLPATATGSLLDSMWVHVGYALKKVEQS